MSQDTFKCGHARTSENTRVSGGYANCRACYRQWEGAYRKRTGNSRLARALETTQARERRLRKLLISAAAAKPHLYPNQQAA